MGVKDLWQLLSAVGRRVSIETLETKVLAIDVSIWITQFIKAMRDEEGKTIHNAHLIGAIRRILKLLFHRIRPVFVFDGVAPSIKQRTLRRRQNFRDNQDGNFKKLGQKLLLSRLKQNAIRSQLEDPDATSSRGGFTSTFIPPSEWGYDRKPASSRELAAAVNVNNTAPDDTPDIIDTNDGVEWEDGYTEMGPGKVLAGAISDEENSVDSGDEVDWDLPVNTEEIDVNVLASLPTQMRKDLIEAARRRERARRRSNYMPVAANPDLYSQTQVANFLRTSKFNQRVMEVQEALLDVEGGLRIAADGNKKYLFQPGGKEIVKIAAPSSIKYEAPKEIQPGEKELDKIAAPSSIKNEAPKEKLSHVFSGSSFFPSDSQDDNAVPWTSSLSLRIGIIRTETETNSARNAIIDLSDAVMAEEFHSLPVDSYELDQDPIPVAGEGESDYEDVQWESGLSSEESILEDSSDSAKKIIISERDDKDKDVNEHSLVEGAEASESLKKQFFDQIEGLVPDKKIDYSDSDELWGRPEWQVSSTVQSDLSVLEQAAVTAAKMNDWAGREMQKFIKSHIKAETDNAVVNKANRPLIGVEDIKSNVLVDQNSSMDFISNRQSSIMSNSVSFKVAEVEVAAVEDSDLLVQNKNATFPLRSNLELQALLTIEEKQNRSDREKSRAYQRDAAVLTSEMKEEVMELLDAFSLPYIVAPSEAEAQCAILERLGLVDGIVTEDSDSFLFGAKSVYKNIFNDGKYVEAYFSKDLEFELGLDQESLIAMAYLLGSDYTDGIKGVGIVNSTEVIQTFMRPAAFSKPGAPAVTAGELFCNTKESADRITTSLLSFKQWVDNYAADMISEGNLDLRPHHDHSANRLEMKSSSADNAIEEVGGKYAVSEEVLQAEKLLAFSENHKTARGKWFVPISFPDRSVCEAYLKPEVNVSTQTFSWPVPELAKVSAFCRQRLGWTDNEIGERVAPVITKCLEPFQVQSTLDAYVTRYQDNAKFAKIKSKRLQNAITMSQTNSTKKKIVGEDHGYKSGISTGGNRATTGLSEARSSLSPAIAPQNGKMKNAKQMVPSERKQKNRNNNSSERRMKKRKRSFGSNDEYHSISE